MAKTPPKKNTHLHLHTHTQPHPHTWKMFQNTGWKNQYCRKEPIMARPSPCSRPHSTMEPTTRMTPICPGQGAGGNGSMQDRGKAKGLWYQGRRAGRTLAGARLVWRAEVPKPGCLSFTKVGSEHPPARWR